MLTDLYVRDKSNGKIHRVGDDHHDSLHVIHGVVEYYNLQNGDGTLSGGRGGYEFVDSDCGEIDENAGPFEEKEGDLSEEEVEAFVNALLKESLSEMIQEIAAGKEESHGQTNA